MNSKHCLNLFASTLLVVGLFSCSSLSKKESSAPSAPSANETTPKATPLSTWVHIRCLNEEFTEESNLSKHEKTFVIVPYQKLKTRAKMPAKDSDDTENLYFTRAAKMAEKILTEAGLKKAKPTDTNALVVGLSWATRKTKLNRLEVSSFTANNRGQANLEKTNPDYTYMSEVFMKAVSPNKKTTRWEITLNSANSNTFYLKVLPPLFAVGKDYLGKSCDSVIQKAIVMDSPEVEAIRETK